MNSPDADLSNATATRIERRRHPRFRVQLPIEIRQERVDIPVRAETTDISRGGCYVQLSVPLPLSVYLKLILWINEKPLRIRGRVVTRHPQFGNGIMFLEFEEDGEQCLADYLDAFAQTADPT